MTPEEKIAEEKRHADLKNQFKEVVQEGMKPVSEKLDTIEATQKEQAEKIALIEKTPVNGAPAYASSSKLHCGRSISKQGRVLREALAKGIIGKGTFDYAVGYDTAGFESEEQIDDFAKGMIDFIEAKRNMNPEAMQRLHDRNMATKASMQEDTPSEGGYLVPDEYQWEMVKLARNRTFALQECTVLPMAGSTLKLPTEASMVTVEWDDEEGQIGQKEGTVGQVSLTAKRMNALAVASNELLDDSAIDIVSMLTEQFGYAVALEIDNQVLAGTGSPVSGLMEGTTGTSVVMATGSAHFSMINFDPMNEASCSLEDGYLANAKWVFGRTAKRYLRNVKDTDGNYIMVHPSATQSGTIWEHPYIVSEKAINTSAVSTVEAVFGNLKQFYIGRRRGIMSLDVDPYGKFDYYQTRFRIVTRWGFAVANANAFVSVVTAGS